MEGGRFELPNPKERIYSPPRLATSLSLHHIKKWSETDSNRRHLGLQSSALPTELSDQNKIVKTAPTGFEPVIEVLQTCALPLGYTAEMLLFKKLG